MSRVIAAKKAAKVAATTDVLLGKATIGGLTDKLIDLREQKRVHEAEITKLEALYKEAEETLMAKLEAEGSDKGSGKKGTVSVTSSTVANVVDWDALNAWIAKTKNFQLYQRRVSDPAFREMLESKGVVPGIDPFTKKRLNVRVNA